MDKFRYRAFISYSHSDEKWARWLHRALESYRVPKHLVGTETQFGTIPARLAPVFRDRDELATATDLGEEINQALTESATQIVICSPDAAKSKWVNEEILAFKRLGRESKILCLIIDGEPNASQFEGRDLAEFMDEECFPAALRYRLDADGELSNQPTEPIAADARPGKDSKSNAKLKLIAGMLGVRFDALKQREQHRRHQRMLVITTAAIAGMLIATTLATIALFARAEAERQRIRAEAEAETALQTSNFLIDLFEVSDPSEARGNSITAREILDKGGRRIKTELADQPDVQARLMTTIGQVYSGLGLYGDANDLLNEALTIREDVLGVDHPDVALSRSYLAGVLTLRAEYETAEPLYRDALEVQRKLLGNDAPQVANTLIGLADLLSIQGNFEAAELLLRESLAIRRQVLGEQHLDVAKNMDDLGMNLYDQGDLNAAEELLQGANAMRQLLLGDSPHPGLAEGLNNLGLILFDKGDLDGAERQWREALAMFRALLGDDHPYVAIATNNFALVLYSNGNYDEAERLYRQVIDQYRRTLGDAHPELGDSLMNLAYVQYDRGDLDAAMSSVTESLEMYRDLFDDDHPAIATRLALIGIWLTDGGDYARAEPMLRDALAMRRRLLGDEHPEIASSMAALARLYLETNRVAESQSMARNARLMSESTLSADHWRTAWAASIEGASLARQGEYKQAETMLLNSYSVINQSVNARPAYVEFTLGSLVQLYEDWDKESQAAEFRGRLVGARADNP